MSKGTSAAPGWPSQVGTLLPHLSEGSTPLVTTTILCFFFLKLNFTRRLGLVGSGVSGWWALSLRRMAHLTRNYHPGWLSIVNKN